MFNVEPEIVTIPELDVAVLGVDVALQIRESWIVLIDDDHARHLQQVLHPQLLHFLADSRKVWVRLQPD